MNRFARLVTRGQQDLGIGLSGRFRKAKGDPIDQEMIDRVRFLAEGQMPYRKIRRLTGVSVSSICLIVNRMGRFNE